MAKAAAPTEVYLLSKANIKLIIPKDKRTFPNTETLEFNFKAGVPQKVPTYVAASYSETYKNNYTVITDEQAEEILTSSPVVPPVVTSPVAIGFDAVKFLNDNYPLTVEKLEALDDAELLDISNVLELGVSPAFSKSRIIEIVLAEIDARNN